MSSVVMKRIRDSLKDSAYDCLEKIGGIKRFLNPGDTVLIKPNFVGPIGSEQGATTNVELVIALAEAAIENGAKQVYIAESSATCFITRDVVEELYLVDAIEKFRDGKIEFLDLDQENILHVNTPSDFFLKQIPVPRILTKVDRIWNVPKAKVHYVDAITCAVKNYVGFLPRQFRLSVHQSRLSHVVAIMHKLFPESLVFVDASIVGEGEGPLNVKPVQFGYLIASDDPVAADVVVGEMFGFQPQDIEFVMNAFNMGIGDIDPSCLFDISEIGDLKARSNPGRPVRGIVGRYKPFRIILGGACYGCLTWLKGTLEGWILDGTMAELERVGALINVMVGYNAVDERINEFIENPYIVIGDCAPERYRNDPRIILVSGCCPGEKIPVALERAISTVILSTRKENSNQ